MRKIWIHSVISLYHFRFHPPRL